MSQLYLNDLDQSLFKRLKHAAKENGVSIEQEAISVLNNNLPESNHTKEQSLENLKRLRKETAHLQKTDSVDLIRDDRDR